MCKVLELRVSPTKDRLNPKGVDSIYTPTNGGEQLLLFVNEKNLYKVIMRSDKPQAEPFQDWGMGWLLSTQSKNSIGRTRLDQKGVGLTEVLTNLLLINGVISNEVIQDSLGKRYIGNTFTKGCRVSRHHPLDKKRGGGRFNRHPN